MKNIFGINITEDKHNESVDGQIFHSNSSEPILKEAFQKCNDIKEDLTKKTSLPAWMVVIEYLSLAVGCFVLCAIISVDVSLREVYSNAPALFYIAVVALLLSFVLYLADKNKKKFQKSAEYISGEHYIQSTVEYVIDVLHIPEDAEIVEVLMFYYKIRNGKMRVVEKTDLVERGFISYHNCPLYAYVRQGNLHLANLYDEWSIPLYCFTGIKRINKKISVPRWKKEIPYNKGEYKKYKMIENGLGYIFFKPYYAICITWHGENYELWIPPYELEKLSSLVISNY